MKGWPWKRSDPVQVVALDRGTEQTKCLRLHVEEEGADILLAAILPTKELSIEWIQAHGLEGLPAVAPFSCPSLTIQEVELPPMPAAEIPDAIRWHLESNSGESMQDCIVHYSSTDPDSSAQADRLRLLAYAARRQEIAEQGALLKRLRLKPHLLEPAVVSLVGAWDYLAERRHEGALLFLDLGQQATRLAIAYQARLLQARTLASLPEAGSDENSQPYYQWAVEIQNAMDTYSVHFKNRPIEQIYLTGGRAIASGIGEYLTQNLGIPAGPLSFSERVHFPEATPEQFPYLFAQALGVARRAGREEE